MKSGADITPTTTGCPNRSYGPAALPCQNPDPHTPQRGCVFVAPDNGYDGADATALEPSS